MLVEKQLESTKNIPKVVKIKLSALLIFKGYLLERNVHFLKNFMDLSNPGLW